MPVRSSSIVRAHIYWVVTVGGAGRALTFCLPFQSLQACAVTPCEELSRVSDFAVDPQIGVKGGARPRSPRS